ncbi:MAG: TonB family protein [Bacteroidaceae bacterium]|nr:TonB family protein [Bacteroidaceae bacterium]
MKNFWTSILLFTLPLIGNAQTPKVVSINTEADLVVKLWDNTTAPHSSQETRDEINPKGLQLAQTSETVLYIHKANPEKNQGHSVIICPGGGYKTLNIGLTMSKFFQENGITSAILKYRLPNKGHYDVPLEDVQAALRYMRSHAEELSIDPSKVAVMGSSAGGHLAAMASTLLPDEDKPAHAILLYPVIVFDSLASQSHRNTYLYLLGKDVPEDLAQKYSLEKQVTRTTPPTLMLLSDDDPLVPSWHSLEYARALKSFGIPMSICVFPTGGHGWINNLKYKYVDEYHGIVLKWFEEMEKRSHPSSTSTASAPYQPSSASKADEKIYNLVEQMPRYPGGEAQLMRDVAYHLIYPADARKKLVQGIVFLRFVVSETGEVGNVEVEKSLYPSCDQAAINAVKSLSRFTPGRQKGQPVKVWYHIPIQFQSLP